VTDQWFSLGNRYGVASERILNAFKDSVKKNDVFEQVKIDNIFKDDLKNQEAFVKGKLRMLRVPEIVLVVQLLFVHKVRFETIIPKPSKKLIICCFNRIH
jgi:hypothetical protein